MTNLIASQRKEVKTVRFKTFLLYPHNSSNYDLGSVLQRYTGRSPHQGECVND